MLGYTLFENNTIGDDSTYTVSNTIHIAQSFTPGTAHNLFTFCFKLINAASCGDATINIYRVDSLGKPTGTALGTMTIANADIGTVTPDWEYTVLSTAINLTNEKLIAVISAAATGLGVRYQSIGMYSAGAAWYSTNSGSTWTEMTGMSFLFQEWGQERSLYGTYKIPLYVSGAGTFNQLFSLNKTYKPNYACINDPIDSVDDGIFSSVIYALGKFGSYGISYSEDDVFLSGLSDGVAGRLTGTTVLWKNGVAGLKGVGTAFSSELAEHYIVKSPSNNEWYRGSDTRLSQIKSIESDTAATLEATAGTASGDYTKAWHFYPNSSSAADGGWTLSGSMLTGGKTMPMRFMAGKWTFTTGSDVVAASGGSALSLFPDPDFIYNIISTGPSASKNHGTYYPCSHIDSDNQVTLWDDFELGAGIDGIEREGNDGCSKYAYFGMLDDLSSDSTATQWSAVEKMDTYTIKSTLNRANIHRMYVRYRVGMIADTSAVSYRSPEIQEQIDTVRTCKRLMPGTSGTFTTLNSLLIAQVATLKNLVTSEYTGGTGLAYAQTCCQNIVTGLATYTYSTWDEAAIDLLFGLMWAAIDAVTINYNTSNLVTGTAKPCVYLNGQFSYGTEQTITGTESETYEEWNASITQFETVITKPGGGVFTRDDVDDLEVGIVLGNISDISKIAAIFCTQLCLIAETSNLPSYMVTREQVGIDDVGFLVFDDKWDEFNQFVGDDGINTLGWKVNYVTNLFGRWIAKPWKVMRRAGIRFIRPISRTLVIRRR